MPRLPARQRAVGRGYSEPFFFSRRTFISFLLASWAVQCPVVERVFLEGKRAVTFDLQHLFCLGFRVKGVASSHLARLVRYMRRGAATSKLDKDTTRLLYSAN